MEVNGVLHTPTAIITLPIRKKARWDPETYWKLQGEK
jgi:hypothetical protein